MTNFADKWSPRKKPETSTEHECKCGQFFKIVDYPFEALTKTFHGWCSDCGRAGPWESSVEAAVKSMLFDQNALISVSEHPPTEGDGDEWGCVLWYSTGKADGLDSRWINDWSQPQGAEFWMKLPFLKKEITNVRNHETKNRSFMRVLTFCRHHGRLRLADRTR